MTETDDLVRLLLRRVDVLSQVSEGPHRIRELTEAVDVSRPTVHRSIKELEGSTLIVDTPDGYDITPYGEVVLEQYLGFLGRLDGIRRHRELLQSLGGVALPPAVVDGAEFAKPLAFAPEKPYEVIEDVVRGTTRLTAFSPVIVERYVSLFTDEIADGTLTADIVTTANVFEYIASQWPTQLRQVLDAGLTVLVTDECIPFGLIVTEAPTERICLIIQGGGSFQGVITNDDPAALAWGRERYRALRNGAHEPTLQSK